MCFEYILIVLGHIECFNYCYNETASLQRFNILQILLQRVVTMTMMMALAGVALAATTMDPVAG